MSPAGSFWPRTFSKLGFKKEPAPAFVPTRDIAARIIGGSRADTTALEAERTVERRETIDPALTEAGHSESDGSREAARFVPDKTSTTLTDTRGKSIRARIMNLSATGVAIEADFRLMPIDTVTMIGAKPVTVGRAIRGGQVFLFDKPLDPARCNKQIVL